MTATPTPSTKKDLTGKTFGGWTVLEETPKTRKGSSTWKCRCECGAVRFNVFYTALTTGRSTSCGCRRKGAKRNRARSPSALSSSAPLPWLRHGAQPLCEGGAGSQNGGRGGADETNREE